MVDNVIATVDSALAKTGQVSKSVERWKAEMPKGEEMVARDKYTVFDRKAKRYRKGIHSTWIISWRRHGKDRWMVLKAALGSLG